MFRVYFPSLTSKFRESVVGDHTKYTSRAVELEAAGNS